MSHDKTVINAPSYGLESASPFPPAIEQDIMPQAMSKTLDEKGFVLAPVSANIQSIEKDMSFDQSANNY